MTATGKLRPFLVRESIGSVGKWEIISGNETTICDSYSKNRMDQICNLLNQNDKQERVHKGGVESLQEAYALLTNIFTEAQFSYRDWVDTAPLPANITWAQLQEVSKKLSDGLADVEFSDEPFWRRGWAYLDGMATKQLLEMTNEKNKTAPGVQSNDGPFKSNDIARKDSCDENCKPPQRP